MTLFSITIITLHVRAITPNVSLITPGHGFMTFCYGFICFFYNPYHSGSRHRNSGRQPYNSDRQPCNSTRQPYNSESQSRHSGLHLYHFDSHRPMILQFPLRSAGQQGRQQARNWSEIVKSNWEFGVAIDISAVGWYYRSFKKLQEVSIAFTEDKHILSNDSFHYFILRLPCITARW